MGGNSKAKARRRKEQAVLERKAKRERLAKALSSLAAFSVPTSDLQQLERGMVRQRKRDRTTEEKIKTNDVAGSSPSDQQRAEGRKRKEEETHQENKLPSDVCGIEELFSVDKGTQKKAGGQKKRAKKSVSVGGGVRGIGVIGGKQKIQKETSSKEESLLVQKSVKESIQAKLHQAQAGSDGGLDLDLDSEEEPEHVSEGSKPQRGSGSVSEAYKKAASVKSGQYVIHVTREEEIEQARLGLPICAMEQEIMEAINYNSTVLICGETGSGKTTQIPQFLYEAGYGSGRTRGQIGVTQPRRIAATSTAERVAQELNSKLGDIVGYQVRYDKKLAGETKLKFMTDGILMRELQEDALLRKYSVIVLDEVHERNLNTDVILGFITRIIPLRASLAADPKSGIEELKLLIMSATLSSKEFAENRRLFKVAPPIINVPAKRFPVTIHFSRKTELHSYLDVAYKKILAIHRKLPNGGILVFVTGQREVLYLTKRLQNRLCKGAQDSKEARGEQSEKLEMNPFDGDAAEDFSSEEDDSEIEDEDEDRLSDVESSSDREELPGTIGDGPECKDKTESGCLDAIIIPLYAKLGPELQAKAFQKPPSNSRLIIIATNVAETSITIPGICYVVDTGRSKQKMDKSVDSGLTQFEVNWISKSSATQRAGRAGRTGPGHCYRLYSSAFFNDNFPQYSVPDIRNTPLESVVLQLKSIGVDKSESFPFPTQPNQRSLSKAERCLRLLNVVSAPSGQINALGIFLSKFPVNPRHARMLVASVMLCNNPKHLGKCLQVAISVAAILSFENPLAHEDSAAEMDAKATDGKQGHQKDDDALRREDLNAVAQRYGGDVFATLTILRAYEEQAKTNASQLHTFCKKNSLHVTVIREITQLKKQLASICAARVKSEEEGSGLLEFSLLKRAVNDAGGREGLQNVTPRANAQIATTIQHAICVGWADRVARRITVSERIDEREGRNLLSSTHKMKKRYQTLFGDSVVSLRRKSPISRNRPEFVVYRDLIQGAKNINMECVTEVHPSWLSTILKPIATFSSPLEDPEPVYDPKSDMSYCWIHPTVGKHDWSLPICQVEAKDKSTRCKAFLIALLRGKVYPELRALFGPVPEYSAIGTSSHPGVIMALLTLEKFNVATRKRFAQAACLKKNFMLEELTKCSKKPQEFEKAFALLFK